MMPFVGFGVLGLIGAGCCYKIPYDTANKELDFELEELNESVKENNTMNMNEDDDNEF